jgi:hypothetical protein
MKIISLQKMLTFVFDLKSNVTTVSKNFKYKITQISDKAPCEGTNSTRLFTPGEMKALAKSKVHQ